LDVDIGAQGVELVQYQMGLGIEIVNQFELCCLNVVHVIGTCNSRVEINSNSCFDGQCWIAHFEEYDEHYTLLYMYRNELFTALHIVK
jgi:hypothetical protein